MASSIISTTLDEYGALIGLTRRSGETLGSFKRRINFAMKRPASYTLEGLQNQIDQTFGGIKAVATLIPATTVSHLILKGNRLIVKDDTTTYLDRSSNLSWDSFQDLVAANFDITVHLPDTFNMQMVREIDNLKQKTETLLGHQVQVLAGQNITAIVFSDTRFESVNDIADVDDYLYYLDRENGILFCGNNMYGTITYSYHDDIVIQKASAAITALNLFDISTVEPILHPIVVSVYNERPISNVWR